MPHKRLKLPVPKPFKSWGDAVKEMNDILSDVPMAFSDLADDREEAAIILRMSNLSFRLQLTADAVRRKRR